MVDRHHRQTNFGSAPPTHCLTSRSSRFRPLYFRLRMLELEVKLQRRISVSRQTLYNLMQINLSPYIRVRRVSVYISNGKYRTHGNVSSPSALLKRQSKHRDKIRGIGWKTSPFCSASEQLSSAG